MLSINAVLLISLGYVALLFAIAFIVDRRAQLSSIGWLRSPVIYTLSISVYCTGWTFYGAVGSAARNGLEFITIYLGPTIVFIGWWWVLRKLVRIGRAQRITSIADLISSRFGKSPVLAVLVTLIALIATTPYIALQLQSVTQSVEAIVGEGSGTGTAFWVAAAMALFAIIFGTRNLDANERHHGVVAAIALEAVVKLVALVAVGVFATFGIAGGFGEVFANADLETLGGEDVFGARWATLVFLSAAAIICLPRQFQVTVVENIDERHLSTASWLFPLYLFAMSLFILPIALVGQQTMPAGANPDLYVLTIPMASGRDELALLAFLGGFSSATSMVILAAIAVSTMVSNHIVMPVALRIAAANNAVVGDVRNLLLIARRVSIGVILGLGYLYFRINGGSNALASIGLIAFVGVAQFLPSLMGGIFWRGATRVGALAGMSVGLVLWIYTLFLPSFGGDMLLSLAVLQEGPFGIAALRPQQLFGLSGLDPLVHAVVWSVGLNTLVFTVVSTLTRPNDLERLQSSLFVNVFHTAGGAPSGFRSGSASSEDLFVLARRILGPEPAQRLFEEMARAQGTPEGLPHPTEDVMGRLERELAGSIGAASAHAMVSRIAARQTIGTSELIDIADETQQLMETSRKLAEKSTELESAATQLRSANARLRALDAQKDEFLSQISHELRTPMTSIRSFSEILLEDEGIDAEACRKFVSIIQDESVRLTRLLDEILDIGTLESGSTKLTIEAVDLSTAIDRALDSVDGMMRTLDVKVQKQRIPEVFPVSVNPDRFRQVLINLLSNAVKYNRSPDPEITVRGNTSGSVVFVDVIDNGGGVSRADAAIVFEKFARGSATNGQYGAGLGLPISRAIMRAMGGDLTVEFAKDATSFFRIRLLRADPERLQAS